MTQYTHLTLDEREKLFAMRQQGASFRIIAKTLGRNPSSLSREVRRNAGYLGYLPDTAHNFSINRKARYEKKISRYPALKMMIIHRMQEDRYSPEMIAGRLKLDKSSPQISHESIYKFIYSKEGMELGLYKHLMCRRPKRNQKYGRKTHSNYGIPGRVSISARPKIYRREFGHFEADTTYFRGSSSINLLTMVDRKTSYFMATLNQSKSSENIAFRLVNNLINFPRKSRRTLTMDNGKEFVLHGHVRQVTGIATYFCHPGSPWEKPYVETSHALLHRFIPKNTDPKTLTHIQVQHAVTKLNNLPRKRFKFRTPAEMLAKENFYNFGALRA